MTYAIGAGVLLNLLGIGLPGPGYGIAKNAMHNLPPDGMPDAYVYVTPGPSDPQTYFYEE